MECFFGQLLWTVFWTVFWTIFCKISAQNWPGSLAGIYEGARSISKKKKNSRPLFTVIFNLKNENFKTRDFSPLIVSKLRVLAGVGALASPEFGVSKRDQKEK